jgi:hypothetical protein
MQNDASSLGIQLSAVGEFVISKTGSFLFSEAPISRHGNIHLRWKGKLPGAL